MSEHQNRLKGSLIKPESRLKGSLMQPAAVERMSSVALGRLSGSLLDAHLAPTLIDEETNHIPRDYKIPESVIEQIAGREASEDLKSVEDPEGIVTIGTILTKHDDPDRRRLITGLYETSRGSTVVNVHIEGEPALRNLNLDILHQYITDGELLLSDQPSDRA